MSSIGTNVAAATAAPGAGKARINLERAAILLIDTPIGLDILSQIFYGFGARALYRCRTVAEAKKIVETSAIDLIVLEALLADEDGYDFVRSLRSHPDYEENRFTPVIVLSAHTAKSKVADARDCGANFFVAKPVSPLVIMQRLLWVARAKRQYFLSREYSGPDRRFRDENPQHRTAWRRRDDACKDADDLGENT